MADSPTPDPAPTGERAPEAFLPVAIVGAGAVGTALAHGLRAAGHPMAAVLSRTEASARELASAVEAPVAASDLEALPERAALVFLCVPDDQIRPTAAALATRAAGHPWPQCLVAHTAGALPAEALRPLATAGAATLSFHPLQAFAGADGETAPPGNAFDGIHVALEGPEDAVEAGRPLAECLGARPFALPAAAKTRYHLAAAMASNFLVTLMAMAGGVLDDAVQQHAASDSSSIDEVDGAGMLRPLVEGTLDNLRGTPPTTALTGPIARGDVETVSAHLEALRAHHPGLTPVYVALATETVRLARHAGPLSSDAADRLLARFDEALDAPPAAR